MKKTILIVGCGLSVLSLLVGCGKEEVAKYNPDDKPEIHAQGGLGMNMAEEPEDIVEELIEVPDEIIEGSGEWVLTIDDIDIKTGVKVDDVSDPLLMKGYSNGFSEYDGNGTFWAETKNFTKQEEFFWCSVQAGEILGFNMNISPDNPDAPFRLFGISSSEWSLCSEGQVIDNMKYRFPGIEIEQYEDDILFRDNSDDIPRCVEFIFKDGVLDRINVVMNAG